MSRKPGAPAWRGAYPRCVSVTLRGLTRADIPAWSSLLADVELVERSGEHYNEADLHEELDDPAVTEGLDFLGAFDTDRLVGYACVRARDVATEVHKVAMEGAVHPDRLGEGLGTMLAAAMFERAQTAHAETFPDVTGYYSFRGLSSNTAQEILMAGIGLAPERWSFAMRADLRQVEPASELPDGLLVKVYDASMADALRLAHNDAFRDHPNSSLWSESMWQQWVTDSRSFRPDDTFVAVDPAQRDRIVAYVQTNEHDANFAATGKREAYVSKVGTLREHRGKGIASALLRHCLAAYQVVGYDEASLDVDSANPTGALGVYERTGFEVESRWTDYSMLR